MIFAIYRWGLNLGTMASPLLGYALFNLRHKSYTVLFWGEALVAVVYALIAFFLIPRKHDEADVAASAKAESSEPAPPPTGRPPPSSPPPRPGRPATARSCGTAATCSS